MKLSLRLIALMVIGLSVLGTANAGIVSLDNLVNGDFEDPDVVGEAANTMNGWTQASRSATGDTNDLATWGNTDGIASQVGMLYAIDAGNSYTYQALTGTTDANGSNHTLTASEGAGETLSLSIRIGIESFSGWQSAHSLNKIGFQIRDSWDWMASRTYYTGTLAQATADGTTADVYLGLDDTNVAGDSLVVTYDFTLGASSSTNDLVFAINTDRPASSGNARGIFDDVSVGVIPEPATMSLLALGGIAMLRRRKK